MSEKELELKFRAILKSQGWHTIKMHGGLFQARLPDLLCMHKLYGQRWVELKVPGGKLSLPQIREFTLWWRHGVKVWIITSPDQSDLLFKPANFSSFLGEQIK